MADIRINQLPPENNPAASENVAIDAASTRRTTIQQLVYAGRPAASQAEAVAGTDPNKAMTPLTTAQAISALGAAQFATKEQGTLADSALQPGTVTDSDLAAPANITYLNQTETTLDFYGGDVAEMFNVSPARKFSIGAGNIEFDQVFSVPAGAQLNVENGAIFIPTFQPVGTARATPLITVGAGVCANYLKMQLDPGINTIRKGFQIGDNSQIGYIECTSSDININRIEPGSTDLISGAVLISGQHVRIGQMYLSRFDRSWTVIDSTDVVIEKVRALECLMNGYIQGSRDVHALAGYTTGPSVAEVTTLSRPRGPMTPGLNSLVLAGCADSSFGLGGGWTGIEILEHGIRVGAAIGSVPNHRLAFGAVKIFRSYGCGFKCDDADAFNIKTVSIDSLYTEDIGNGNWFGNPGYQNWASNDGTNYVNTPSVDNDGNKGACDIRNTQRVQIGTFQNRAVSQSESGQRGLWVERSTDFDCPSVDTEKSRTHGILVQSGGTTSPENIFIRGRTSTNIGSGVMLDASTSNAVWRGINVEVDSQNNGSWDFEVTANLSGATPFATKASKIAGFARGGASGLVSIPAIVLADPDFLDEVEASGTFTPSITFATPGDLALSSVTAFGIWKRKGRRVYVEASFTGTPTFTASASGSLRLTGLPFAASSAAGNLSIQSLSAFNWPASRTTLTILPVNANSFFEIRGFGNGVGISTAVAAQVGGSGPGVPSGTPFTINYAGEYRI